MWLMSVSKAGIMVGIPGYAGKMVLVEPMGHKGLEYPRRAGVTTGFNLLPIGMQGHFGSCNTLLDIMFKIRQG